MSALRFENTLFGAISHRRLRLPDRRGRLERNAEVDGRTVRDTTLDATGVVRLGRQFLLGRRFASSRDGRSLDKCVVVDRAGDLAPSKTGADLETLGGGDAQHGVREHGFHLVEDRLAEADGTVPDDARHGAADAVVGVAELLDDLDHAGRDVGVGAADGDEGVDGLAGDGGDEGEEGWVG